MSCVHMCTCVRVKGYSTSDVEWRICDPLSILPARSTSNLHVTTKKGNWRLRYNKIHRTCSTPKYVFFLEARVNLIKNRPIKSYIGAACKIVFLLWLYILFDYNG